MNWFKHVKLKGHRVLKAKAGVLRNLGQINVICGKNNSGKSTLLEALFLKDTSIHGINKSSLDYHDYLRELWSFKPELRSECALKALEDIFLSTFNELPMIFFEDEIKDVRKNFEGKYVNTHLLNGTRYSAVNFDNYLNPKFPESNPRRLLIDTNRFLQDFQEFSTKETVSPSGDGILNELFNYRSNLPNSEESVRYNRIRKAFTKITSGCDFEIITGKDNIVLLKIRTSTGKYLNAHNHGKGCNDLLMILFFACHPDWDVLLIEEPETHMHPEMQRKLLHFLKHETDKQYFITTHSNVFLDASYVDRIFLTKIEDGVLTVEDETSRANTLYDLGYAVTDNLVSDLLILVEGPTDKPVIEEFLIKMGLWSEYNVKIWALGGDIMDQHDLSVFAEKYQAIGLIDCDPKSKSRRDKFKKLCKDLNIYCHQLQRYSIENYFTLDALRSIYGSQISKDIVEIKPNEKLEDQIELDVKKRTRNISKEMSLKDIEDTDFYTDFLLKVKQTLENSSRVSNENNVTTS